MTPETKSALLDLHQLLLEFIDLRDNKRDSTDFRTDLKRAYERLHAVVTQ